MLKPFEQEVRLSKPLFGRKMAFQVSNQSKENKCLVDDLELDIDFKSKLISLMNKTHMTNAEIYKAAGITRQVFSKIISFKDYLPKKETILCLIIGMKLCLDDAIDLLDTAGYSLSDSLKVDKIVKNHILENNYDLDDINYELDRIGAPIIGWKPRD